MSLTRLAEQIADVRAQAERLQSKWASTKDRLDTDPNLSDAGKRRAIDAEHERTRAALLDLRKRETELVAAERRSLERSLFGLSIVQSTNPQQILVYRDAQDRAAKLSTAEEAQTAYTSAVRSDDETLAAAILSRAVDNGWTSIVDDYTKDHPDSRAKLDDLVALTSRYEPLNASLHYLT